MIGFELNAPYLHEIPFEDEPDDQLCADTADNTHRWFAFDMPEAVLPYVPWRDTTVEPGAISWQLDRKFEKFLLNWAIAALNLTLTAKGNLKKLDREHLDKWISRLRDNIETDLVLWLENDPRYQEFIRDQVNSAIQDLLEPRREGQGQSSSCPEATQERSAA